MTTPTRDIDENAPRIESRTQLAERLEGGCKPRPTWKIGAEHEKIVFRSRDLSPTPYDGEMSIRALLEGLRDRFAWSPINEGGHLIGLKKDGQSVSLEPGGQFELSGAPLETLHQVDAETRSHIAECKDIGAALGLEFLALGFSPVWSLEDTPQMPKGRYGIMRRYMERVGRLGKQMMFRSCTVQTNLDFSSEADMVKKMRVSIALQPLATALFANSPFAEGRTNGFLSYRSHVWGDTDPDRTGMLPFVFEDGFGFERYVDYALDTPMYFARRGGSYVDCAGLSFRDFMKGELSTLPGVLPAMDDFDDHLSTIFPEVRLKTFLEMRGADAGPADHLAALSAFWVGLLYDDLALDGAWDIVKGWTAAERESLRRAAQVMALHAPVGNTDLRAIANLVVPLARAGLERRAYRNEGGVSEALYLDPILETLDLGRSPAERLLDRYNNEWGRDITRVYREVTY